MKSLTLPAISLLLGLVLLGSLPVAPVAACECPGKARSPESHFAQAEVVFSGRVIAGPGDPRTQGDSALLEVQTIWKGNPSRTTWAVYAPYCNAPAAAYYHIGDTYLIYGTSKGEVLELIYGTSKGDVIAPVPCSRTGPLAKATADLAVLGKGAKLGSLPTSGQSTQDLMLTWSLLAVLCLGTGLALVARHKKQVRS